MANMEEVFTVCGDLDEELFDITCPHKRKEVIIRHIGQMETMVQSKVPDYETGLEWINTDRPLSLNKDLHGKVVVLDFFTYCCINCLHVLPDLKALEAVYSISDGVAVIGVHSAKFANEKILANILSAVLRYDISHPVVNDHEGSLWHHLQIHSWPTFVIVSPQQHFLYFMSGEGHRERLLEFVGTCVDYYKDKSFLSNHSLPLRPAKENLPKSPLLFPGKVATNTDGSMVVVSDTGHNRILILGSDGIIKDIVGSGDNGFKDGTFPQASFSSPQGTVVHGSDVYVADTDNHAIRKIDLKNKSISTVVGTGSQGQDTEGGKQGILQEISSPWALALGPSIESSTDNVLYIAMAGIHQVWVYFLTSGKWYKGRSYDAGICVRFAGSGNEENRNNSYPEKASFAQPSGLAISRAPDVSSLYIADSESSSIRAISLKDAAVKSLVGGERDPKNLFAFGDHDGIGVDAKLQHPLDVAVRHGDPATLYVADTFNNKIKAVNIKTKSCTTILNSSHGDQNAELALNEPGGICLDEKNNLLYIADTNNHSIKVLNIDTNKLSVLPILFTEESKDDIKFKRITPKSTKTTSLNPLTAPPGGTLQININLSFNEGLHYTDGAPSAIQIWTDDGAGKSILDSLPTRKIPLSDSDMQPCFLLTVPDTPVSTETAFYVECMLYYCDVAGVCKMKGLLYQQTIHVDEACQDTNIQSNITEHIE